MRPCRETPKKSTWPKWISRAIIPASLLTLVLWASVPEPKIPNTVERHSCTITVTETLDIYGPLATAANGAAIENAIEQCWNGHRSKCCPLVVDITIRRYPNASTFLGTGDGGWNIELVPPPHRSYVNTLFESGAWQVSSPAPAPNDLWTFCHEAGHIFGLPDDYSDNWFGGGSTPHAGHAGHMMASFNGAITQHEIDDILKEGGITCPAGCCETMR